MHQKKKIALDLAAKIASVNGLLELFWAPKGSLELFGGFVGLFRARAILTAVYTRHFRATSGFGLFSTFLTILKGIRA
jgi:hypothetical protein